MVDALPAVHLRHLRGAGRILRALVLTNTHEAGEPEADALARVHQARARLVDGGDGEVGRLHLPHHRRGEPDVRADGRAVTVAVVGLGLADAVGVERVRMAHQIHVREARADLECAVCGVQRCPGE